MTVDKLMSMSAAELEAIPQAQLEEYFKPYLHITRPELQTAKPKQHHNSHDDKPLAASKNPEGYNKARQYMLETMGIDLDDV